jgi:hypothetical protein
MLNECYQTEILTTALAAEDIWVLRDGIDTGAEIAGALLAICVSICKQGLEKLTCQYN